MYFSHLSTDLSFFQRRSRKNSAVPSEEKLVNFMKHRKEFTTLARIQLLQCAAMFYSFKPDANFKSWFESFPFKTEEEK